MQQKAYTSAMRLIDLAYCVQLVLEGTVLQTCSKKTLLLQNESHQTYLSEHVIKNTLPNMNRTIITVVGKDTVGIIAKVCSFLAENNINILDISQTIVQGYFNMMMIVDPTDSKISFEESSDRLAAIGTELGVQVKCQREDIFDMMHRV